MVNTDTVSLVVEEMACVEGEGKGRMQVFGLTCSYA